MPCPCPQGLGAVGCRAVICDITLGAAPAQQVMVIQRDTIWWYIQPQPQDQITDIAQQSTSKTKTNNRGWQETM